MWGGYTGEFKLIPRRLATELRRDLEDMRRQSEPVGPSQQRRFKIEISAFEYIEGCTTADVDHFTCFVYTLEMIVAEKLRAICQQSPDYSRRANPTPRARDFYDIWTALNEGGVSLTDGSMGDLIERVFAAKDVDLRILDRLEAQREFHRAGWPSVEIAVNRRIRDYDFYFDYVLEEVKALESLWVE